MVFSGVALTSEQLLKVVEVASKDSILKTLNEFLATSKLGEGEVFYAAKSLTFDSTVDEVRDCLNRFAETESNGVGGYKLRHLKNEQLKRLWVCILEKLGDWDSDYLATASVRTFETPKSNAGSPISIEKACLCFDEDSCIDKTRNSIGQAIEVLIGQGFG